MTTRFTPFRAVLGGALAGLMGTLAMDLVWYRRYRRGGGEDSFPRWELSVGTEGYEGAAAPAQVGKRVLEGLFETKLPDSSAALMNNVVHWATGAWWGTIHGILVGGSTRGRSLLMGPVTGTVAFLTSYAVLAPARLYKPLWSYDVGTQWRDWSAHLAFGATTGVVFALLGRSRD